MRALVVVTLSLAACFAAPAEAAAPPATPPEALASEAEAAPPAPSPSQAPPLELRLFAASVAALGGAAGVLLSLPAAVPIIYLAALVGVPAAAGALPLLLVVPLFAALGSGGAALLFAQGNSSEGIGPWLTGTLSGAAAGVTVLVVGALVVPQRPSTLLDLHLGVLSVIAVPSLAAAATAAVVAPFFVSDVRRAEIE